MEHLNKRIHHLSPAKRALLESKLKKRGLTALEEQVIPRRLDHNPAPLSFAQQRLWFLNQLEPDSPAYNVLRAIRMKGDLDTGSLRQTLNEIVRRHESLRTTFQAVDGKPVQVVADSKPVDLPVIDISELDQTRKEIKTRQLIASEGRSPFNLAHGPLFRAKLVRLDNEDHILFLAMHHIISDGWSKGILFRELGALYEAFSDGKPSPLPELPIQYADYAIWQQNWIQSETMKTQLAYWQQQLDGDLPKLELPTDHPRPEKQTLRGDARNFTLSAGLSESLRALSRNEGTTLFMTLLAAFQALLHRYTGQTDIIIGSLVANRNRLATEELIGFLINALTLRTSLSGNPTFRELLSRTKDVALGAFAHQDLPFEKLVEVLQPERSLSRTPLFQVMFNFQNATGESLQLRGLTLERLPLEVTTAILDLTLTMADSPEGITGLLEYSTDLFEAATIARIIGHFEVLLEGIAADPDRRLTELPVLSKTEQDQLLRGWNHTERHYPLSQCFHQLFEEQVQCHPNAIAVSFKGERLTYQELNRRANRIARILVEKGVEPDIIVALLAERSINFLTAMLAVFKAGGAYLPLDPSHPASRINGVIKQSGSKIVLTTGDLSPALAHMFESLPEDEGLQVFRIEELLKQERREENLALHGSPKNLSCVIFTSGSTGIPKGAMIEHAGMLNHLFAKIDDLHVTRSDTVAQTAPLSFVISIWQFLAALAVGGRVHIFDDDDSHDPTRLWEEAEWEQISIIEVVPSLLRAMLEEATTGSVRRDLTALRWMVATGEALPPDLVRRWLKAYPQIPLLNAYGSTECSDDVAHYAIDRLASQLASHTPIGRPVSNTQLYILDSALSPVPVGVLGELYVGGIGVGRGYFNDVKRTAEVFIPNPFSSEPGARLYKTGDLARYLSDGNIEYLGRIDHQVQIRGNRVELGEIEAVLAANPQVRQVVAVVREEAQGDHRLVVYVVPEQNQAPAISELRSYVKERLPEYMVPQAFVLMNELPLTPNGKLDRRALPQPEQTSPDSEKVYEAPRTLVEKSLVEIFGELIGIERVSIHDNFFEIGGHSLLAAQVISRVRQAFRVDLPLRTIFERPTVTTLSESIEQKQAEVEGTKEAALERVSREQELPLSFAQQRLWFMEQINPGSSSYNVPRAMRIEGNLNLKALQEALQEIVNRHEVLRTSFVTVEGEPHQVNALALRIKLQIEDLMHIPESEREAEALRLSNWEVQRPFEIDKAPLLRAVLLRLGEEEHILVLTMHHIISDGWSIGVFYRELSLLYEAFSHGLPSPLEPLAIQYADYGVWQRQRLQGEVLKEHLRYWSQQLDGAPPVLELPTDRPRPAVPTFKGARHSLSLSKGLSEQLKELAQQQGVTLYMLLLGAFKLLLFSRSRQSDIVIGTPVANRQPIETEPLIGLFVNTLVMRTDLSGEPTFTELLARVKEVALGAYAHQEFPFDKLVEELKPERTLSHNPLFQVWFVLQNAPIQAPKMTGLKLTGLGVSHGRTRHDLQLSVWETTDGLQGSFEYSTDLFKSATVANLARYFEMLLEIVSAHPDARLSALLKKVDDADQQQHVIREKEIEESSRQRLKNIRRKVVIGS